jgi:hypothetical protein
MSRKPPVSPAAVWIACGLVWMLAPAPAAGAADDPAPADARRALLKAVRFFHAEAARHGGYVWRYSADLAHGQGEGTAGPDRIWIQPPGTPAVGSAFLDAYAATGEADCLAAARDAAHALVRTQLHSGGWAYSGTFDPDERRKHAYRVPPSRGKPDVRIGADEPGGWAVWRRRRYKANQTILDDDTTQSALRFLVRFDVTTKHPDASVHEAAAYGLKSLMAAQYPVGAWSHNYDRFPRRPPDPAHYPVTNASYPASWSRTWTKAFAGCYMLNDRITLDAIRTLLDAHAAYGKAAYREAAVRGGAFLLRARLPDPQPAWAQQYDRHMHPVWDRPFEPPAVTGLESQDVLETLLLLYERTGEQRFLDAVPASLAYLRRSRLPDGTLARFYELRTNRPLFFTQEYDLTYDRGRMPSHYAFVVNSRLDAIALRYRRLARDGPDAGAVEPTRAELAARARDAIATMDERGAWTEPGTVRDADGRKVAMPDGVISSETFIRRVQALAAYVRRAGEGEE